ncbi:MAG: AraC family transcriptional regulator, partial [Bacteroidaceae bacterium]|nr:AraC family transcriptional regulator [Bacteroidaceae bacterium]
MEVFSYIRSRWILYSISFGTQRWRGLATVSLPTICVTPKYLSEVCKKVSSYSANSWINRYAAIDLVHLLKDKSLSLTDIAYMFDFSSQSHFSRFVQN